MKLVAIGANIPSRFGEPKDTLYAALTAMAKHGVWPTQISRLWKTAPVPYDENHPWYYNAVAMVETSVPPHEVMTILLYIEEEFGRVRRRQNEPRIIDLDLIDYDGIRLNDPELILPHPRMAERAFVLLPMTDILDDWKHPVTGKALSKLVKCLPLDQQASPVEGGWDE